MQQYFQIKSKQPEAILLFRVGDFYETFGEDAVTAAQVLGIVQTHRNNGGSNIELAGFPHHSLDTYLPRLVKAGYRVAVCEQLEKPSKEKKIVKRGVVDIVTPGIAVDDKLLDHKQNNFLASLSFGSRGRYGVAFLDISTGEFLLCEGDQAYVDKLLQSFRPSEVIFSKSRRDDFQKAFGHKFYMFPLDEWVYTLDFGREQLLAQFSTQNLKGFGVEEMELAQTAAGATLHYLSTTENKNLQHIRSLRRIQADRYVWLDRFTIRNLELLYSPNPGGVPLIDILDRTFSPMGGRLLKKWVALPLKDRVAIEARHQSVAALLEKPAIADALETVLRQVGDLERLISKVPLGKINPREIRQLRRALEMIGPLKEQLSTADDEQLVQLSRGLDPCAAACAHIEQQLVDDPPVNLNKGGVMADGFHEGLDELRHLINNSKQVLEDILEREKERTGITSLKIGFNNVFGYYLEVTNKYKDQAPEDWIRKQTLTNAERYITDELKQLEAKILGAEEQILHLETELYEALVAYLADYIGPVQQNALMLARLDCLLSFARVAAKQQYVRPQLDDSYDIDISGGRHPVIEQQLELGEAYVPNDVFLDRDSQQLMMITGPNMAGKSALLRQTALIVLLAQIGSFVPAERARLGIVDKIFTRVGASDNISSGESTFMVEMSETASIMNNLSDRSLILLDEIGRGTSTYDGISIAWSIAEYLHEHEGFRPKTLFATHYHELNELANLFSRIKNFHIATREVGQKIIFLRKLTAGGSQHSFGIHVAKLAGMPREIVLRANDILGQLEQKFSDGDGDGTAPAVKKPDTAQLSAQAMQLSIFETADPVVGALKSELLDVDLNTMTPIECMLKLKELHELVKDK